MYAHEAKEISTIIVDKEMENIFHLIQVQAVNGKYVLRVQKELLPVEHYYRLKELNYTVYAYEDYYTVEWS
jgi:hypothetical protein